MPKETIMSKITDEEFQIVVEESSSLREIAIKCGYSNYSGASSNIVKTRIEKQNLLTDHFKRKTPEIRSDEQVFISDSPIDQSSLRRRYFKGKFSDYRCSICEQEPIWQNKELVLTLDHINGHNRDNRLENLRWVCPNCDRQLDTFAGKNIQREEKHNYCIDCGIEILMSSTRCPSCSVKFNGLNNRRVDRPNRNKLKSLIRSQSFVQIAKQYGVTDNAIRKWCDEYSLPRTKREIMKISDNEWELL